MDETEGGRVVLQVAARINRIAADFFRRNDADQECDVSLRDDLGELEISKPDFEFMQALRRLLAPEYLIGYGVPDSRLPLIVTLRRKEEKISRPSEVYVPEIPVRQPVVTSAIAISA